MIVYNENIYKDISFWQTSDGIIHALPDYNEITEIIEIDMVKLKQSLLLSQN